MLCPHETLVSATLRERVRGRRARDDDARPLPRTQFAALPETHYAPPTQRLTIATVKRTKE